MVLSKKVFYLLLLIIVIIALILILVYVEYVQKTYTLPRIAWMFWDTVDLPPLIGKIKENNFQKLKGWQINYLNNETLGNYIKASEYPSKFNTLRTQHKADWIRLHLLNRFGGVWLDASIIINDPNALDNLYEKSVALKSQMTGFSYKNYETNVISSKGISLYIENWFIMAPIRSTIISLWLVQFEKAIEMGLKSYRQLLESQGLDTSKIFNREDQDDIYLTQHACLQYVLQTQLPITPPMLIMKAEDSMLKIRKDCDFSERCTMETIRDNPEKARSIAYIKLVGGDRKTGIDITSYFD